MTHQQLEQILQWFYPAIYDQHKTQIEYKTIELQTQEGNLQLEACLDLKDDPSQARSYYVSWWNGGLLEVGVFAYRIGWPTIAHRSKESHFKFIQLVKNEPTEKTLSDTSL